MSRPIESENQIKQIATLSANGDAEIGELVATALDKVGRDGVVTVEESRTGETSLEVVEGMQFDRGYKSHYMVTDNNTMSANLTDALVLLVDSRISAVKDLLPILESVSSDNKSLLIIAEDIDGEALATLIVNKMRGILKVAAVKAPDFGERRLLILEDIATITGGTVVSPQKGMKLDKFNKTWFGSARTITVGKDTTTIIDGKGDTTAIETRVLELKAQIDKSSSPYEIEKLQERLAKMIGGVAIINVGGGTDIEMKEKKDRLDDALQATQEALDEGILPGAGVAIINVGGGTDIEMKEKKDRLDDALQATQAALDEGILPGAGVALLQARKTLKDDLDNKNDISKGAAIVFAACGKPFKQILENAGEDASEWLMQLLKTKNMVPNITEGKIVDAFDAGIIDPTKVVRSALENAAAAAVTLLMTECVIHDKPDTKKKVEDFGMAEMGM